MSKRSIQENASSEPTTGGGSNGGGSGAALPRCGDSGGRTRGGGRCQRRLGSGSTRCHLHPH